MGRKKAAVVGFDCGFVTLMSATTIAAVMKFERKAYPVAQRKRKTAYGESHYAY